MPGPAQVAVVITHYRSPEVLDASLRALAAARDERLEEVVVVDCDAGAHNDLEQRLAREHPWVSYVPARTNVGFGALVNAGLIRTSAEYVLVMNADVRVSSGAVDALAEHLDTDLSCGLVAPLLRNGDGSLQHTVFRFHRPSTVVYRRTPLGRTTAGRTELDRFLDRDALERAVLDGGAVEADWVLGAAMCVRRSAVERVGAMDAAYFLYFEDVDWCLRFWQDGWAVHYLPTATATHDHGRASAEGGVLAALRNPLTRVHIRSAFRFFGKHGTSVQRPALPAAPPVLPLPAPLPHQRATTSAGGSTPMAAGAAAQRADA